LVHPMPSQPKAGKYGLTPFLGRFPLPHLRVCWITPLGHCG
jgi:hypothetical protein